MPETQQSISAWAQETFGPVGSNVRVAVRANEEMAELLRALSADPENPDARGEAADVKIALYRLADRMGFDLDESQPRPGFLPWAGGLLVAAHAAEALILAVRSLTLSDVNPEAVLCVLRVVNYLHYLAAALGFDLDAEVDRKMAVNRAREWRLDGGGHGYHVRDKVTA